MIFEGTKKSIFFWSGVDTSRKHESRIELLAPIARLLHISLDTLLSFQEKLTDMEIETLIRQMGDKLEKEGFEKTYEWAVQITKKYPNCNMLIWQIAVMLDAGRITGACGNPEQYDEQIMCGMRWCYRTKTKRYSTMQPILCLAFI